MNDVLVSVPSQQTPADLAFQKVEQPTSEIARFLEAILRRLGYQLIGRFRAMTFGRLFPKDSRRIFAVPPFVKGGSKGGFSPRQIPLNPPFTKGEVVPSEFQGSFPDRLTEQYRDHALSDFEASFRPENAWVLMENGEVLAGLQVDPQRWEIQAVPGPGGFLALRALPHIPFV